MVATDELKNMGTTKIKILGAVFQKGLASFWYTFQRPLVLLVQA